MVFNNSPPRLKSYGVLSRRQMYLIALNLTIKTTLLALLDLIRR